MKKIWAFFALIAFIILFWFFYNRHQEYSLSYKIDDFNVTESFDLELDKYFIRIQKGNLLFEVYLNIPYTTKRSIVSSISYSNENNMECIKLNEDLLEYPICKQNSEYVSYYLNDKDESVAKDTYNSIDIYNYLDNSYLVWNYKGFYYLNKDKITSFNLFEKDTYIPYLLTEIKDNLFIVDYDSNYQFNKYYLIDLEEATYEQYKIDTKLSVDSVILGTYKNSVYIVDPKEEQEYEINVKKAKIYKTSPKVLVNDEWEKTTISKLVNKTAFFKEDIPFKYSIENKKLYYYQKDIRTKITNMNVDTIVKSNDDEVFFISNGTLYNFRLNEGITKLMKYSEWNFNYNNCVFIYINQ